MLSHLPKVTQQVGGGAGTGPGGLAPAPVWHRLHKGPHAPLCDEGPSGAGSPGLCSWRTRYLSVAWIWDSYGDVLLGSALGLRDRKPRPPRLLASLPLHRYQP